MQDPGGKGLNAARAAHALGAKAVAVALLRGHTGKWIEEMLGVEGVAVRAVVDPRREPLFAVGRRP